MPRDKFAPPFGSHAARWAHLCRLTLGTSQRISATTVLRLVALSVRSLVSGWTVIKEIAVSPTSNSTFRALTEPHQLNAWFTQGAKVNLRVGGNYSNQDGDRGKFLESSPMKGYASLGITQVMAPVVSWRSY